MVCVYPQPTHIPHSPLEVQYYFQIILADIDLQWFRLFPMILQQTRIPQLCSKVCLGLTGRLLGSFFWGLFRRVSVLRVGAVLDGSIIIRSTPARRVSPMKYRAMFFLSSSFLICAVPEKRTK